MREKTIEETYQKKTPLQHILLRPDTYVGSIEMEKSHKWILRSNDLKFTNEEIEYVPALYKIFDQVLVNAADNYQRDKKMNLLKVEINQEQGFIKVHNNGKGIPVEIHKEHNIYVPELIFGHLLTGSNYNDNQKKVVGGRNGYGAKLANIFSHKFIVQCGDGKTRKKFKMVWRKNMTSHGEAEVQGYSGKDFTSVTFYPEFTRFGMHNLNDDIVSLMRKRVYDMAGLLSNVKVYLNEKQLEVNSFLKYVDMYFTNAEESIKIRDSTLDNERWQVVVSLSDGEFKQVSFVNSICTTKGGTHVNYVTEQIVQKIQERIAKKDKNMKLKPFLIKGHLWIFVNALIQNPAFDSQTKETLTLKPSLFGSKCDLSQKFIKDLLKTGIVDDIYNEAKHKQLSKLAKMTGGGKKSKLLGIPKLEDANDAGTRNSDKCTLILTEGDSAKSLAMAGLEVIGRDTYGVFPLKGKLLNVREASNAVLMKNEEIQNVMKIVGLQVGKNYQDLKSLRYGSIMIMSDQDTDGSHIKGLVVNFIHFFWPSLFKLRGFLKQFITPLLKVSKNRQAHQFYTMSDFKRWSETLQNLKGWKIKYYKGLGTSTDKEAQEYFQNLNRNRIYFIYESQEDDEALDLVFNKKKAEKRKEWLSTYDPDLVMAYDRTTVTYRQFINKEFIHFSNEDNNRSIASIIDGFKPGQRKIIYACFKRNLKDQIKVAQLAGYVAEHSAYHHGEMSLTMTIVNMAQNFVGSNNINLLMPNGQFGSRNQGGKDHASARYIFTNLNKITRFIYPEADDHTLNYLQDDGQLVQPEYYVPIIPMGLVNGCEGIGSGWSTFIPNFNPREISEMIRKKLEDNEEFTQLRPWYKGYSGHINEVEGGKFEVKGIIEFDEHRQGIIHVKELPIGKWTKDYKQYLNEIMTQGDSKIVGLREYHTKNRVHFQIELNEDYAEKYADNILHFQKFLKLTSSLSMKNLVGFNKHKKLQKYPSTKDIMEHFFEIRLIHYQKRKEYLLSRLQRDLEILSNKERFILEVVEERIVIRNVKRVKIIELLKSKGFKKNSEFTKVKSTKGQQPVKKDEEEGEEENKEEESQKKDDAAEFNYLLNMPLWNLTYEKVQEIKKSRKQKEDELMALEKTQIKEIWLHDLREFQKVLEQVEQKEEEERKKGDGMIKKDGKGQKARKKADKKEKSHIKIDKKPKGIDWDSDEVETKGEEIEKKNMVKKAPKQRKQKAKKIKENTQNSDQDDDLISRVKRKMNQANSQDSGALSIVAKGNQSKQMTLQGFVKTSKDNSQAKVQIISSKAPSNVKRRKMELDSEEESEEEWNEDWD